MTGADGAMAPADKGSLVGLSRADLSKALRTIGVPEQKLKMRAQQIWHWVYVRGAQRFAEMSSLSKDLRAQL
ncbi:MAG TPA: 23S rRNA (adenine(2503)-C(2))-methyltransferase RlmN, partial [Xanthobacteraceae bacterium]|nr:23S rRNA (adenine(2503)-C(2))-methyltransferase RlmN [Xanthobacteraceae bacterium]